MRNASRASLLAAYTIGCIAALNVHASPATDAVIANLRQGRPAN